MKSSVDKFESFVDHPRYGKAPRLTGLNPDGKTGIRPEIAVFRIPPLSRKDPNRMLECASSHIILTSRGAVLTAIGCSYSLLKSNDTGTKSSDSILMRTVFVVSIAGNRYAGWSCFENDTRDWTQELTASFTDEELRQDKHWYYWRVSQSVPRPARTSKSAHGHLTWSSPSSIVVE